MKIEQIQILVSGRVQGVGFRYATQAEARKLGLKGWVRNLPDDRVELVAQGDPSRIDSLVQWCGIGPALAKVTAVDVITRDAISDLTFADFEIERS